MIGYWKTDNPKWKTFGNFVNAAILLYQGHSKENPVIIYCHQDRVKEIEEAVKGIKIIGKPVNINMILLANIEDINENQLGESTRSGSTR